ncbi:hypothetical protein BT67DRAFT_262937 [Trichocladium antarcticum]|uniref:Uncharacterized protein n=1 Tax=Trichocladium antarcticum TaxID=1450529 RepID=A0AAN6ZEX9_9PEZI|nr:hypothetical protein BT67DRAFT_262937 [Trichocladium antarcticum]
MATGNLTFSLPFRPIASARKSDVGSTLPPLPRAGDAPVKRESTSPVGLRPARSSRRSRQYYSSTGPIAEKDTPQERFKEAMKRFGRVGPSRRSSGRRRAGAPTGSNAGVSSPPAAGGLQPNPAGLPGGPILTGRNSYPLRSPKAENSRNRATARLATAHPGQPNPIMLLSFECQARGFNPVWDMRQKRNGRFTCFVSLAGHWVIDEEQFPSEAAAKTAAAERALRVIWAGGVNASRVQNALVPMQVDSDLQEDTEMTGTANNETTAPVAAPQRRGTERADSRSEHTALLDQVRRATGVSLPESARDNPDATRAFLEGLAVGARLAGPALGRSRRSRRARSFSPSTIPSRPVNHRERSPRYASDRYRERSPAHWRDGRMPPALLYSGRGIGDYYRPPMDRPAEEGLSQNRPAQNRPAQNRPPMDRPAEEGLSQNRPAQNRPAQDHRIGRHRFQHPEDTFGRLSRQD